jgi:DNA polymerase III subunit epsilon
MLFFKKRKWPYSFGNDIHSDMPLTDIPFTVLDTETTGLQVHKQDRLLEIGAVQVHARQVSAPVFQTFVNPEQAIPPAIEQLTGISSESVHNAPDVLRAIQNLSRFVHNHSGEDMTCVVGHHVNFDLKVLKHELLRRNYVFSEPQAVDTFQLAQLVHPAASAVRDLRDLANLFGTPVFTRHTATGDCLTTAHLFCTLLSKLEERRINTWGDVQHALALRQKHAAY